MKKDAYYFPHFCNARGDRKIKRLMKDLGIEGYGIYFMTLEVLREQSGFRYPLDDLDLLADEMRTSEAKLSAVVKTYDLFEIDEENNFFSPKLILYLQPYLEKSKRAQLAAKKRWDKVKNEGKIDAKAYANALPEQCQSEYKSNASQNARKVNESKVKKSKENDTEKNELSSSEKEVINFYNKNIGLIPPTIYQQIESYLEDGIEPEMIIKCLEIAVEQNVPKWSYAKSILEDKFKKNIKTLYDFEASEIQRKQKEAPKEPVEEFVLTDEMLEGSIFDIK